MSNASDAPCLTFFVRPEQQSRAVFAALKKLFVSPVPPRIEVVIDPVLGHLCLSEDAAWWEASLMINSKLIGFKIAGDGVPHPMRIAQAQEIVRSFTNFEEMIRKFLENEARDVKHLRRFSDEIGQLEIEDICLLRPGKPSDGMVYFKGPDAYRLWRCDYVDSKPKGLGFDD